MPNKDVSPGGYGGGGRGGGLGGGGNAAGGGLGGGASAPYPTPMRMAGPMLPTFEKIMLYRMPLVLAVFVSGGVIDAMNVPAFASACDCVVAVKFILNTNSAPVAPFAANKVTTLLRYPFAFPVRPVRTFMIL